MRSPRRTLDPIEQAYLYGHPNPKRIDCPDNDVLRGLANKQLPISHPARKHIVRCSPCWREFREFEQRPAAQSKRRRWIPITGVAACLVAGIFITTNVNLRRSRSDQISHSAPVQRSVDLWNGDTFRGSVDFAQIQTVVLPLAPVQLRVVLPRFSRQGSYDIAICSERNVKSAIVKSSAVTTQHDGKQIVTVLLDIRRVRRGTYWLSTRHDHDDASYYYPVKVL